MTLPAIKFLAVNALSHIDTDELKKLVHDSKRIGATLIERMTGSSDLLNKWVQNYGDAIGLSSKQIITAEQIIKASAAQDAKLKSVLKMTDLSEDVQLKVASRETEENTQFAKSTPSLG